MVKDYLEKYIIRGGKPLTGTVSISGAKNAAVAVVAAALIADGPSTIENIPEIRDIRILLNIFDQIGVKSQFIGEGCLRIDPSGLHTQSVTFNMVRRMRASYYLLGAMLSKCGFAEVALPGGCEIGQRPIDQHVKGMSALGATVTTERGTFKAEAERLTGSEIYLDVVSVGATINIMLAATRAEGLTTIVNAAKEPHVVDVANFLNMMGASVKGAGTDVIRIKGTQELHGCTYALIPDQIEAATFMIAAAATMGDVIIKNVIPTHLEAVSAKLMEMGVHVAEGDDGSEFFLRVMADKRPRAVNIKTLPYPGFPTDLQQPIMSLLSVAEGTSVIVENIFEERFKHVDQLRRMGAHISVAGRVAIIEGVDALLGSQVVASDLRAGAALVVAGLMADDVTEISGIELIDRGYESLDEKLRSLGADITRAKDTSNGNGNGR